MEFNSLTTLTLTFLQLQISPDFLDTQFQKDLVIQLIASGVIAIGIIYAVRTYKLQKEHSDRAYNLQKEHNDYQRLYEVYKMINTPEERDARKNIYDAYRIYNTAHKITYGVGQNSTGGKKYECKYFSGKYDDIFNDPLVLRKMGFDGIHLIEDVERVRATFDNIGSLFGHKLIPEDALLEAMWGTGRVCWICLKDNMIIERDKRKVERYMDNFERFFKEIEKYRDRQSPKLEAVEPY
jgi:hypothetical protein